MCQLSHVVLNSISVNILETINWSVNKSVSFPAILKNTPSNSSKATSTSYNTPPILQYMYSILDKLNINTSKLDDKPFDIIRLKNLSSEVSCVLIDNNINMNLEKRGSSGKIIVSNSWCWTFKI